MKENKPSVPEQADRRGQSASTETRGSGESTGRSVIGGGAQDRKSHNRTSRETHNKLGNVLEGYYERALREGVPERFQRLLEQYNQRHDEQGNGAKRD